MMTMVKKDWAITSLALVLTCLLATFYCSQQVQCAPNGQSDGGAQKDDLIKEIISIQKNVDELEIELQEIIEKRDGNGSQEEAENSFDTLSISYYAGQVNSLGQLKGYLSELKSKLRAIDPQNKLAQDDDDDEEEDEE